jgi:hypothetical protein
MAPNLEIAWVAQLLEQKLEEGRERSHDPPICSAY